MTSRTSTRPACSICSSTGGWRSRTNARPTRWRGACCGTARRVDPFSRAPMASADHDSRARQRQAAKQKEYHMRFVSMLFVIALVPLTLSAGEKTPSKVDYAEFSKLVHLIVVKSLPKQLEDTSGWGQT